MIFDNIILNTDSYKASHHKLYPPGATKVYSYFESRGGRFKEVVFFGLHYLLKKYLSLVISQSDIETADRFFREHIGDGVFNREGWEYIFERHGGRLPVSIKAVPEGTVVPVSNVLMTVENTDPKCYWLTNYLETILHQIWYGCTVATLSREMKKLIKKYLDMTGDPSQLDFKLHDFGFRGVSSVESAAIGGAAHLINFKGTDTIPGILFAREYYDCPMAGFSIPATEHSTITSWGRDGEQEAYHNAIRQFGDHHHYAVVSDSYNIYQACDHLWGDVLKNNVCNAVGTLVIRPDSGTPHIVVPEVLRILGNRFGYSENNKGYKVLNPKVRIIQGDGIDYDATRTILDCMVGYGWSADNITFGMGGGLLQKIDRDTQKFAFKCSYIEVDGVGMDVKKTPATDPGKTSKAGRFELIKAENRFTTVCHNSDSHTRLPELDNLKEVFRDGKILVKPSFDEIRERASVERQHHGGKYDRNNNHER